MVDIAEKQVIIHTLNKSKIIIWCQTGDSYRESLLKKRGYQKQVIVAYMNWRDLNEPGPEVKMPERYTLHNMVNEEGLDLQRKINRMARAFDSKTYADEV